MNRNKNYRLLQHYKRENKVKNIIKNAWQEEYHPEWHWSKIMIDTPKMCGGLCCKNPRKNKAIDNDLTMQELKDKENIKDQLKYL